MESERREGERGREGVEKRKGEQGRRGRGGGEKGVGRKRARRKMSTDS